MNSEWLDDCEAINKPLLTLLSRQSVPLSSAFDQRVKMLNVTFFIAQMGNVTVIVAPRPGSLTISTLPPMWRTRCRMLCKPIPC